MENKRILVMSLLLFCLTAFPLISMEESQSTKNHIENLIIFSCPACGQKFPMLRRKFLSLINKEKLKCNICHSHFEVNLDSGNDSKAISILLCTGCDEPINNVFNLCEKCKKIKYCSHKCRLNNWSTHKSICAEICDDELKFAEKIHLADSEHCMLPNIDFNRYKDSLTILRNFKKHNIKDFNVMDKNKLTVLMHACDLNDFGMVKILIDSCNAHVNAQDASGKTPLMYALKSKEIVEFLLAKGADLKMTDNAGLTALDLACTNEEFCEALSMLKSRKICAFCKDNEKKAKRKCARCLSVYYCSEKCQNADWKNHKEIYHRKCEFCKKATVMKCKNCKSVYYCSKECQIKGWLSHKFNCRNGKKFNIYNKI